MACRQSRFRVALLARDYQSACRSPARASAKHACCRLRGPLNNRGLLLEQFCECGARIRRRARGCLSLDYGARREECTNVARVFVHDLGGDWFTAFEASARIEVVALTTTVKLRAAICARTVEGDIRRRLHATRSALHGLSERHHLRRAWAFTIAIARLWLRFRLLRFTIVVHVTALTIFAIAHLLAPR